MQTELKYAPQTLAEVVYPNAEVETLVKGFAGKQLEGNVLLYGPNGTGKTTVARLLPKAIDGSNAEVEYKHISELLKMDADELFTFFHNSIYKAEMSGGTKYFIVAEELDAVKGDFARFWTTLEKVQDRVMLIITTNEPMGIHKSLRSRCTQIAFSGYTAGKFLPRAQKILVAEGVNLPDAQVLQQLKTIESLDSVRAYMKLLDRIILVNGGHQPPPEPAHAPAPTPAHAVTAPSKRGRLRVVTSTTRSA
jgi:DNA polymerase III delta prime subunit